MTLEELKARIEAEALRRTAARDGFTLDAVKSFLGQEISVPPELRMDAPPVPNPLTYAYFDALSGRTLVAACYSALLGRGPDPTGMEYYLSLLASGASKARVVGAIAYSAEARQRHVQVRGLLPRFAIAMVEGIRGVGSLVGWVVALFTLHGQRKRLRILEHRLNTRLEAVAQHVGQSSAQVALRIDALRSVLEARD